MTIKKCPLFFLIIFFSSRVICIPHFCAGVAELRGCSATNGGGGRGTACSWKQHPARVGQPGYWSAASSGEMSISCYNICTVKYST